MARKRAGLDVAADHGSAAKPKRKRAAGATKYETLRVAERLESIRGWAMHGGNKAVAKALGVAESTLYAWKAHHPELKKALEECAADVNGELLVSAFDQARGYTRPWTEVVKVRHEEIDPETHKKLMVEEAQTFTYDKFFPPDARMTQYMLNNRFRNEYQRQPESEIPDQKVEYGFDEEYAK